MFSQRKYSKHRLSTEFVLMDFGIVSGPLLEALGAVFLVFVSLKTGLKIHGFSVVSRISSGEGGEGK